MTLTAESSTQNGVDGEVFICYKEINSIRHFNGFTYRPEVQPHGFWLPYLPERVLIGIAELCNQRRQTCTRFPFFVPLYHSVNQANIGR